MSEQACPKTEILGIPVISRECGWIGGYACVGGGYHGLLKTWWEHFGLKGVGLLVGEDGERAQQTKKAFQETYNVEAYTVSLANADIIWDITKPLEIDRGFDWIVCQATLEHVVDPVAAIKNMAKVLKNQAYIYIHTVGPDFPEHRYPLDCYRFFRDALIAMAELAELEIADLYWTKGHCFAVYRKGPKQV